MMKHYHTPRREKRVWKAAASILITGGAITTGIAYLLSFSLGIAVGIAVLYAGITIDLLAMWVWST